MSSAVCRVLYSYLAPPWPQYCQPMRAEQYNLHEPHRPITCSKIGYERTDGLTNKVPYRALGSRRSQKHYVLPEIAYLLPVFNSPLFKTGRICLRNVGFGNPSHNIKLVADLYSSSGQIGTLADINTKFGTEISQFQFNRIHTALNSGRNLLNLNIGLCNWHQEPRQSALIQIACTKLKGCRAFYNIFRAKANDKTSLAKCESKWHTLLTTNLSVTFWDRAWKL